MKDLIIIGGPTASGKTKLAIEYSMRHNGEIVNADSMQVYIGMDIGTNKGNLKRIDSIKPICVFVEDQKFTVYPFELDDSGITGWMFDLLEPDFNFTVSLYQKLAYAVIDNIQSRKKQPILVGGTGLYIDAVLKGYDIDTVPDTNRRQELSGLKIEKLQQCLVDNGFDLDQLNNSDRNNPRRLIRLIEKIEIGKNSEQKRKQKFENVLFLYPKFEKDELLHKINLRVEEMVETGLIEEVQGLLAKGYNENMKAMQATGYAQVLDYLEGKIKSKKELIDAISLAHRQYAKRQITWFEGAGRGYDLQPISFQ